MDLIETLAVKKAITFIMEVEVSDVEFEGDSKNIIQELRRHETTHNASGLVLEDAKLLPLNFQRYKLSDTCCSGKTLAHALARRALDINSFLVWMKEVTLGIVYVLLNEFSVIYS